MSNTTEEVAVLQTSEGEMVIRFWPDVAPKTVENFKKLAREGFYDGTAFHRIVKNFMIQGGDPLTRNAHAEDQWGTGGPGYRIKAEFNERPHVRGVVSMARSQHPDSAGSQFFICLADARFLDRQYTAFGQLIKGDEVLGRIGDAETVQGTGGEKSKPAARVELRTVRLVPAEVEG
jgi:peptidyl-prolyl cis-trans isomerase B (cyclophilin B)